jgi:hypothetical protein
MFNCDVKVVSQTAGIFENTGLVALKGKVAGMGL